MQSHLFISLTPKLACRRMFQLILAILVLSFVPVHASEVVRDPVSSSVAETAANLEEPKHMDDDPLIDPDSVLYRSVKYAGKFHLMALHFPIAFLLAAMLVQWFGVLTGRGGDMVAVFLWFGAATAVAAATLGWMYAYDSVYFGDDEQILFWHRWLGTGTAIISLVVALARKLLGPKRLGVALTVCAGLVAAAAHFGASLVYGSDFLMKF